jgi:hypothetical protein
VVIPGHGTQTENTKLETEKSDACKPLTWDKTKNVLRFLVEVEAQKEELMFGWGKQVCSKI